MNSELRKIIVFSVSDGSGRLCSNLSLFSRKYFPFASNPDTVVKQEAIQICVVSWKSKSNSSRATYSK